MAEIGKYCNPFTLMCVIYTPTAIVECRGDDTCDVKRMLSCQNVVYLCAKLYLFLNPAKIIIKKYRNVRFY